MVLVWVKAISIAPRTIIAKTDNLCFIILRFMDEYFP